ncbi:MAG: M48 family metalloprotease [Ktedonobacterales bacterium]|nr:M48 family metalloprotease [Ktedonobacterales bacterium]
MTRHPHLSFLLLGGIAVPLWIGSCLHVMTNMPPGWLVAHAVAAVAVGGLLLVLGVIAVRLCHEGQAIRHLQRRSAPCPVEVQAHLQALVAPANVRLLAEPAPLALCAGLLRPAIYVSDGLIDRLPLPALRAAIAHEEAHRRRRDPLRRFLGTLLAEVILPTTWTRTLAHRWRLHAELLADRSARQATSTRALALALWAVLSPTPLDTSQVGLLDGATDLDVRLVALTRPLTEPLLVPLAHLPLRGPFPGTQLAIFGAWVMLAGVVWASPALVGCLLQH